MGFNDRVGPPFKESDAALRAYQHAAYVGVSGGLEFDNKTGEIATSYPIEGGRVEVRGTPGEVINNDECFSWLPAPIDRLNLAFTLGYCLAQIEAKKVKNGADDGA